MTMLRLLSARSEALNHPGVSNYTHTQTDGRLERARTSKHVVLLRRWSLRLKLRVRLTLAVGACLRLAVARRTA